MNSIIGIENINKSYNKSGNEVKALKNININVNEGELFGLIGPDGAGKSTLFEILVTLREKDSGKAQVWGFDVEKDFKAIRQIIGYMPGRFSLYQDLTVIENLEFFASIFNTTVEKGYDIIKDIWIQIEPFSKRPAGKLSGGMKQKLALCCALIHQPKVLFLDEPTTGVDPVSRREFWQMLKLLKKRNITIFVSTPYMDEAVLCDRVALMQDGVIMNTGKPETIINSFDKVIYDVKSENIHNLLNVLAQWDKAYSFNTFGQSVHFCANTDQMKIEDITSYLKSKGIINSEINVCQPTIEDCFIELMTNKTYDK